MVQHSRQPKPSPGTQVQPEPAEAGDRVAKALARAGVASRREVERLIGAGRVALNGRVLDSPAVKVGPADILTVDGAVIGGAEPTRMWRYHKPAGLVTTHSDPQGRPTVFEHLPEGLPRVISVGRLDLNSEGLLLLTNDGGLARSLELPASGWVRRYRARAYGQTSQDKLDALKQGITVEGVAYGPIEARLDKVQGPDKKGPANVWISVALTEGKNREVRRVLEALGLKVNRLIRLAYGPFALGTLETGSVEEIGPRVIREQLADFIAPANLPLGDRRPGPAMGAAPQAGRRAPRPAQAGAAAPVSGRDKPPRRDERPRPTAAEPAEKKVYKAGWAKPKRKAHPHPPVPGAKAKPPQKVERQSWGERSTYKPPKPRAGENTRVLVGDRPAWGTRPGGKPAGSRPPAPSAPREGRDTPRSSERPPEKRADPRVRDERKTPAKPRQTSWAKPGAAAPAPARKAPPPAFDRAPREARTGTKTGVFAPAKPKPQPKRQDAASKPAWADRSGAARPKRPKPR